MSKVKLTLPGLEIPVTGKQVTFSAPCDCSSVECLQINGVDYCVVDALGRQVTGTTGGGVWAAGAQVSVILDCEEKKAYLQNGNPTLDLIGAGMVNPNLLHNWYFANPVNQRNGYIVEPNTPWYTDLSFSTMGGHTDGYCKYTPYNIACGSVQIGNQVGFVAADHMKLGYVGAGYTIDRWRIGSSSVVLVEDDGYISFDPVDGIARNLEQQTEVLLDTGMHTVSALLENAGGAGLIVGVNGGYVYATCPSDEKQVVHTTFFVSGRQSVTVYIQTAKKVKVYASKLEIGSTQTLAHQDTDGNWILNEIPDYSEELLKCCMSTAESGDDYANNKKTPAAINAVNKSGDTMTGVLNVNLDNHSIAQFFANGGLACIRNVVDGANYHDFAVGANVLKYTGRINNAVFDHDIIHTGNMEALSCGRIATGSYVGTGTYGVNNPNRIVFDGVPKYVCISGASDEVYDTHGNSDRYCHHLIWHTGMDFMIDSFKETHVERWATMSGNTLSWYDDYDEHDQLNAANEVYNWFAVY